MLEQSDGIRSQVANLLHLRELDVRRLGPERGHPQGVALHVGDAERAILGAEGEQVGLAPRAAGDGLVVLPHHGGNTLGNLLGCENICAVQLLYFKSSIELKSRETL